MEQLLTLIIATIIFFLLYFKKIINQREQEKIWFKKSINGDLYKYHTYADNVPYIRNGVKAIESVTSYKEGEIQGVYREFNMEGKETLLIEYKDGKKNGICKKFSEGGGLSESKHYDNDKLNGVCRFYDSNGIIIKRTIYQDDLKVDDDIAYCKDLYIIIADNIEKTVKLRTYYDEVDCQTRIDGIALALQANVDSLLASGESPNRFSFECFIGNMVSSRGIEVVSLNIEYVIEAWNIVGVNPISHEDASDICENLFLS